MSGPGIGKLRPVGHMSIEEIIIVVSKLENM